MTTVYEAQHIIQEAANSLNGIVGYVQSFVSDEIVHGSFGSGGWNDVCAKRIGAGLVSSVNDAVDKNMNMYDCMAVLEKIANDVMPVIAAIESAKEQVQ